ncbi:MAG TPA: GYD domain-containing protein [Solirubrobacterales bacterium]|nr:GYD domain-containing protein [Solirubrobacterales bacterium]
MGEYDFVSVVEAPDEKTMAKLSVEMGSRGTTTNETMTAIPVDEFVSSL